MTPLTVAYADPPYIGQGKRYGCEEIDHEALIARLVADYPDGWALSCTSNSLRQLLPLCPEKTRVACWVKTYVNRRKHVHPAYSWEPVIFRGGRVPDTARTGVHHHTDDSYVGPPFMRHHIDGFTGAKPELFCLWLFQLLGLQPGDILHDLFPGTGAVSVAWDTFSRQGLLWSDGGDPSGSPRSRGR